MHAKAACASDVAVALPQSSTGGNVQAKALQNKLDTLHMLHINSSRAHAAHARHSLLSASRFRSPRCRLHRCLRPSLLLCLQQGFGSLRGGGLLSRCTSRLCLLHLCARHLRASSSLACACVLSFSSTSRRTSSSASSRRDADWRLRTSRTLASASSRSRRASSTSAATAAAAWRAADVAELGRGRSPGGG